MKITKQRLKEIIREELGSVEEGVFTSRSRLASAEKNLASARKAEKLVKQLVGEFNAAEDDDARKAIRSQIQALLKAVSNIQEGSREDMMMPAISQADMEAAMATDEPRHEGGTPEERLLNKLLIVSNIGVGEGGAAAARKLGLDGDEEVIAYLDGLLGNQMYRESGLEENITPGVQQLMKHHPHAAAKIKELAGNGYRASEIKRMLQLR